MEDSKHTFRSFLPVSNNKRPLALSSLEPFQIAFSFPIYDIGRDNDISPLKGKITAQDSDTYQHPFNLKVGEVRKIMSAGCHGKVYIPTRNNSYDSVLC